MHRSSHPEPDNDWLLDMRLYSASFSADRASMLLAELGLTQQSLRQHLAERAKFFANRDRLERLKKLISPDDSALDIDRKIIAVLAKADQPEFFNVLISLFDAIPEGNLDTLPPAWEEMEKYGVQAAFWELVATHFGYQDDAPTLKNLLIQLLVSDLDHACRAALPDGLKHLILSRQGTANAVVCLAQWRDSSTRGPSYEALSAAVAETVKLEQHLGALEIDDLAEVKTFLMVEKAIASRLRDRVMETADAIKPEAVRDHRVSPAGRLLGRTRIAGHPLGPAAGAICGLPGAADRGGSLCPAQRTHQVAWVTLTRRHCSGLTPASCIASTSSTGISASLQTTRSRGTGTSSSPCARRSRKSTATDLWPSWRWRGTNTWRQGCSTSGRSTACPISRHSMSGKWHRYCRKGRTAGSS